MTRSVRLYLEDIANAISEIEEFMKDLSFDKFAENALAVRAVTMDFIVIGEAAKHLPVEIRKRYPRFHGPKLSE